MPPCHPRDELEGDPTVTRLLRAAGAGDRSAAEELLRRVYGELRAVAGKRMSEERQDHTLQPTALVHEAWLRLVGAKSGPFESRGAFFKAAAEAMRRILIEHARARGRDKRGGGARRVPLSAVELACQDSEDILSVDEAIRRLEVRDQQMAEIVKLRFFAGLTEEETGQALELSERTVRREWVLARAWLTRELGRGLDPGGPSSGTVP